MNRRSFIGTAASVLLLPSLPVLRIPRPEIDLTKFCDDDGWNGHRYDMSRPFVQEGLAYATDAKICVRIQKAIADESVEPRRLPPASKLPFWGKASDWQPWPSIQWGSVPGARWNPSCPVCFGKGRVGYGVRQCYPCEGEGFVAEFLDDGDVRERPCKMCDTTGHVGGTACDYCEGKGETDKPSYQAIGGELISPRYDQLIREIGDVQYAVTNGIVRFRFDGGEGAVACVDRSIK